MKYRDVFSDNLGDGLDTGPALTNEMVSAAQAALGYSLPVAYVELLRVRNGGYLRSRCHRTTAPTSFADDHVQVTLMYGVGFARGIDSPVGSAYMIREWGYPNIGVVVCETPTSGHTIIMLDYRKCGPEGEPEVVHVDEDGTVLVLASDFASFIDGLVDCSEFPVADLDA